jgi:hypothetical protein
MENDLPAWTDFIFCICTSHSTVLSDIAPLVALNMCLYRLNKHLWTAFLCLPLCDTILNKIIYRFLAEFKQQFFIPGLEKRDGFAQVSC